MANPRKFSEKIALHNQKQAEETAAFEKIMREVSDATNKVNRGRPRIKAPESKENDSLRPAQQVMSSFRSGSLPNVAAPEPAQTPEDKKPEEASLATQYGLSSRSGGTSPARVGGPAGMPGPRGRASSSVGPMRRPADRKHDTSPYGSTVYLSPPDGGSWRRTNSDSALHQACDSQPPLHLSHMSHAHPHHNHRRGDMQLSMLGGAGYAATPAQRPRSSCEIPRIPNANSVYESGGGGGDGGGGGGMLCAEMSVPGGSLPDLTSVHYHPHPHPHPHQTHPHPHSPHPHSPHTPADADYHARYSSGSGGGGSPGGGSAGSGGALELSPYDAQNHLSVPNTNNYLHHSKNVCGVDAAWMSSSFAQPHCSPPSQYSSASNINLNSPTMAASPGSECGAGGESPQPQSSDYNNLHQALLQPFEQITMDWAALVQSLLDSGWTAHVSHADDLDSPTGGSPYAQHYANHETPPSHHYAQSPDSGRRARDPVAGGGGGVYGTGLPSPAPPSIPDIILTDYSACVEADWAVGVSGEGEEAALRAGLDLDELTLLEEPSSLLPDAAVEHEFRLDRL